MMHMEPSHSQLIKKKRRRWGRNITTCYRCGKHEMELVESERIYRCSECDSTLPLRHEHSVVCLVAEDFKKKNFSVKISNEFPCEGFGATSDDIDISCTKDEIQWIIEAKGHTKNPSDAGTDVQAGLGKLLLERGGEKSDQTYYGLAIPVTPHFLDPCKKVSKRDREFLRLHWMLVLPDGAVLVVVPGENLEDYWRW